MNDEIDRAPKIDIPQGTALTGLLLCSLNTTNEARSTDRFFCSVSDTIRSRGQMLPNEEFGLAEELFRDSRLIRPPRHSIFSSLVIAAVDNLGIVADFAAGIQIGKADARCGAVQRDGHAGCLETFHRSLP